MIKILVSLTAIALLSFPSFGLEVEEVLKKMQANFSDTKQLEYSSTYELFKGHTSDQIHTSYSGYVFRSGSEVYQKINETEFIYGKDFFLKISHSEKAVVLDLAQKNINQEIDLTEALKSCSEKSVVLKDAFYIVTLKYKSSYTTPFQKVEIKVDKSTFKLAQLDLFYAASQNFSEDYGRKDLDRPHLRIKFENMNSTPTEEDAVLSFSNYITKKGNLLQPKGVCMGYAIIDNRIK